MTDRISIPALRDQLALESDPDQPRAIYQGELAALVEAVEAAQGIQSDTFLDLIKDTRYDRLRDALARFDFGEHDGRADRSAAPMPVIDFGGGT